MTNQKIVISNGKSHRRTMAAAIAAVAVSDPSLSLLPTSPVNYFTNNNKLENGAPITALLDSMRASSPTRTASDNMLRHPSALTMFEDIMAAARGKQLVVFLDYDGTLSPIVSDPDQAFITNEMRMAVRDVARFFPTAIVSGRSCAKVYKFVRLSELYYAGSHGMDIKGPSNKGHGKGNHQTVLCQPARLFLPMIDEVRKSLVEKIQHIPGAKVEDNKFCLSVHYRCVPEKRWSELAEEVKWVIKDYQRLRLNQGRKVLEICPAIKWDKGNAVEFLLESLGYAESDNVLPIYIGDDRTDEDAFKMLKKRGEGGIGILVSKAAKETSASYSLKEPAEVMHFLKRLVEWKKSNS